MGATTSNGQLEGSRDPVVQVADDDVRMVPQIRPAVTPQDVVPRLVGLGVALDAAQRVARAHPEQRIADALDALEELDATRRVLNPIVWVDAAVSQQWDLTDILARRREREHRLAAIGADRQQREEARDAHPTWRAIAERWDAAISSALDDEQLDHAVDALTEPVAGIGRCSVPVARADLIAWAVEVHEGDPATPLADALTADLERGPTRAAPRVWPLPEPPDVTTDRPCDVPSLSSRIGAKLGADLDAAPDLEPPRDVAVAHRTLRFGTDLER